MTALRLGGVIAVAALLAGCTSAGTDATTNSPTGGSTVGATDALVVTTAPWQVGQWWTHDWTLNGGNLAFQVKSIVVSNVSGAYTFATDSSTISAQAAAFFFMDLGTMGPDGLMVSGDYAFPWYKFPLQNNATWKAQEVNLGNGLQRVQRALTLTAHQMGSGPGAHFVVEARQDDGLLYARYDYLPSLGWFSEFNTYTQDESGAEVPVLTIKNSNQGMGYTGTYYAATGRILVSATNVVGGTAPSQPAYHVPFTVTTAETHVLAILFSFGVAGAHHTQIVAPDGQHWEATAVGDLDGNGLTPPESHGGFVFVPAVAGQWEGIIAGGGAFAAGGGIFAFGIAMVEGTL